MTAKNRFESSQAALSDVALIDARACAACGNMSVSWWHEKVASGEAPKPVIRSPRCTRWRLADVVDFWRCFGEQRGREAEVLAQAHKASRAARAKRIAGSTKSGA